jgi:hypothetical protein
MSENDVDIANLVSPKQRRAMIHLAFLGGLVPKAGDLKPELNAKLRKELIERKMLGAGPKTKQGLPITLQDRGWRWVMDNLTTELPPKEQVAGVLMTVLSRLDKFLRVNDLAVQDVIEAKRISRDIGVPAAPDPSVEQALLRVALELGGGRITEQIRLRDLRPKMDALGYTHAAVDQAIKKLQLEGFLSVIPIDLPTDIDDRDRAAVLDIAGVPRYAVILKRSLHDSDGH